MSVDLERRTDFLAALESRGLTIVKRPRGDRRSSARRSIDRERAVLATLAASLIAMQRQPLILIDRTMTVLLMNDAAQRWLDGISCVRRFGRKLEFKAHEHFVRVTKVLKGDAESECFALKSAGRIFVSALKSAPGRFALISVTRFASTDCNEGLLQRKWGLTAAESQVALGIFNGLSLVQVAKSRGASVNTVKTQARQVFLKCRVHSQVALTRSISELFAIPT